MSEENLPVVLVVDDEPINLDLLERTLTMDYEVHRASSGQEALAVLSKLDEVAVIVTDQRMPGMSGTEFLKQARLQRAEAVRMIVTGYTDPADLVDAINSSHVYRYLRKPWNVEELQRAVRCAVRLYQAGGGNLLDESTGLPNRGLLRRELEREVARAVRLRRGMTLEAIRFKGFEAFASASRVAASDLMSSVADELRRRLRPIDMLGVWDEGTFVVILPEAGPEEQCGNWFAQWFDSAEVSRAARAAGVRPALSAARCPDQAETVRELLAALALAY